MARVRFQILDAVDVPDDKFFVIRRDGGADRMYCVASVADFTNIGTTAPADGEDGYYRVNDVTFTADVVEDITEAIANTKRRVESVIAALKEIPQVQVTESYSFD